MISAPSATAISSGQPKAATLLARSAGSDKIAHAYLFRGPDGVGKREAAIAFAARLNCDFLENGAACGRCPSCRKLFAGNHPDFIHIEPDGAAIKISQIRELKKALTFPPLEARHRVALLADVHTMRREAANSMLKTLEEPPADTILILTGDEAGGILPTILSRCQVIPFFALPYEHVAATLVREEEIDGEEAAALAAAAEGSLGRARMLHKSGLLAQRRLIVEALLRYPAAAPEAVEPLLNLAEESGGLKETLPELLDLLRLWFRDLIVTAIGGPAGLISSRDLQPLLAAALQRWSLPELIDRFDLLAEAEKQLSRNCNRALVCEVLFFALL
ncbi:MAG: DNA polymerase III subunit delta' [Desulfobulbaceae bacterium]|nr:DNA polymerase III subunit delta' [Desulfobulbaceae bacterium]